MPKCPAHRCRRRPPYFHPAALRTRSDGWSLERQCAFLASLYATGSVSVAARSVGMSRASAYALRERAGGEGFAFAWDHVLTPPGRGRLQRPRPDWRKLTTETLFQWADDALVQPVVYRGKMVGIRQKPDVTALFRLMRRGDAAARRTGAG
ncbi:MAG: hypothetical protein CL575_04440 [Altererythrobacter sp.]|nr:hypothetical protein [Altererythrobacter sp.]|tara:strand:+ start:3152 stop:3604 length:453 start_codon:yes stop_codon:yes gene_type:complete